MRTVPRTIDRLLVANRGEIACRVFATCRRLGIGTVAVFSDPDANAPHVRDADRAVPLGGLSAASSYLRPDAIIAAARASGADAIHPGYGFLAEDADFARAVVDAGLTWVGPAPDVIAAMGSKIAARELMEAADVPVLPGTPVAGLGPDALIAAARAIGLPVLVKASAGGGGRGMRRVDDLADLEDAVAAAAREAEVSFGDGSVFLERMITAPRHVEVQILGDVHGGVAVLPERDCSLQRRHQKLIEESPAPRLSETVRVTLADAARRAATALGYTSAGTVEFVVTPEDEVFFLEVNTRLQVEHPVTELICGLDLVELQLRVAEGERLPAAALHPEPRGHAIEARLVAEDPAQGWLPQTGPIERFELDPGVRVDAGVRAGSEISPYYDSLLAKVIVHAPTREAAVRRLADALARARIAGPATNRDLLVRLLRHPDFACAVHHTQFLDQADLAELARPLLGEEDVRLAAAAAALARQAARRSAAAVLRDVPSGFRTVGGVPQSARYDVGDRTLEVRYQLDRAGRLARLDVDGERLDAVLVACGPDRVELLVDGVVRRLDVFLGAGGVWVSTDEGEVRLAERPRFEPPEAAVAGGSLAAPMPGTVVRVLVSEGDAVEEAQLLLVMEAMKMELEILAPASGHVSELAIAVGDHVQAGQTLTVVSANGKDGP